MTAVFSVVTVSYNQVRFIERTLKSVISQAGVAIQYIVVDPGSTDGSLEIISRYRDRLDRVILEPDCGAADGLNKGFAVATGDIFYYLNSDDMVAPGAFAIIADVFERRPHVDVLCGHGWATDADDAKLRRIWSDPYNPESVAYGASIQIQPSTFIRAEAFRRSGGFNPKNHSNWDGELMVSLMKSGAKMEVLDEYLSCYRLHSASITGTGSLDQKIASWNRRRFELIKGRSPNGLDRFVALLWFIARQLRNPRAMIERLRFGPLYRRMA